MPTVEQLKDEGYSIVGAAADTTGNTLTVATYHILSNNEIYKRATEELTGAFPRGDAELDFLTLEKLPYLVRRVPTYPPAFSFARYLRLTRKLDCDHQGSSPVIPRLLNPTPLTERYASLSFHSRPNRFAMFYRVSLSVIGRLPRVVPEPGAVFNGYSVPAGLSTLASPQAPLALPSLPPRIFRE